MLVMSFRDSWKHFAQEVFDIAHQDISSFTELSFDSWKAQEIKDFKKYELHILEYKGLLTS